MMNCKKVRLFLPGFAAESLEERVAGQVSEHVQACPECRVSLEKTRKLRALLALKRHEQPDEFFLRTFVTEFHHRLDTVPTEGTPFWERIRTVFEGEGSAVWAWRASAALAAGVVLVLSLQFFSPSRDNTVSRYVAVHRSSAQPIKSRSMPLSDLVVSPDQNTVYVLDRVAYNSTTYEPAILTF